MLHRTAAGFGSGQAQLRAAGGPRRVAASGAQPFGNDDLLLARRLVRVGRELVAAIALPRAETELEAAVIAVARVDRPVATRLALRQRVPDRRPVGRDH